MNKPLPLLTLIAIGVCFALWQREPSEKKVPTSSESIPHSSAPVKQSPGIRYTASDQSAASVRYRQMEWAAGLSRGELQEKDGMVDVKVELKRIPTCFPGDADAIEMDRKVSSQWNLLLSLEPVESDSDIEPQVRLITSQEWEEGKASHAFIVEKRRKPVQMGLFVCLSESVNEGCRKKTIVDINQIFLEHTNGTATHVKERLYYYQYLILDSNAVAAFETLPKHQATFDALGKYLAEREFSERNAQDHLPEIRNRTQTVSSLPTKIVKGTLSVRSP